MSANQVMNEALAADLSEWMPPDQPYLVAVSGGCDSMSLLHFLTAAGYVDLTICHLNHCLRGAASDEDEALVRKVAEASGLALHSTRVEVEALAKERKLSLEVAAREARYEWFAAVAEETGIHQVILAHHADDQVETILINWFRGSGPRGLSGMKRRSERSVNGVSLALYRPFLTISKEQIIGYAAAHQVAFREDESNADEFALRNRIRHRLIPEIESVFGREVRKAVLRSGELAERDEEWMASLCGALPAVDEKGKQLEVSMLREMPAAQRDRLLLQWLRENEVRDCGYEEVRRVSEVLLSDDKPAKANLPGNIHVRRRSGVLFLEGGAQ